MSLGFLILGDIRSPKTLSAMVSSSGRYLALGSSDLLQYRRVGNGFYPHPRLHSQSGHRAVTLCCLNFALVAWNRYVKVRSFALLAERLTSWVALGTGHGCVPYWMESSCGHKGFVESFQSGFLCHLLLSLCSQCP